ncbi:unnamed protein product [Dicrocoelium dendriticum]|nr:unnamed protein product [Dicrocoelium dendriticum]
MGDFNVHCLETSATIGEPFKADLQELVTSVPIYNHIAPTRFRTGNRPSLLDSVFTNEKHMIDVLNVECSLGRSDHALISFDFICCGEQRNQNPELVRYDG